MFASVTGMTVIAWGIATFFVAVFTCSPIHAYWDVEMPTRKCIDPLRYFLGVQIANIVMDLAILILPMPYLWRLRISLPHKIALVGIFMLGGFVVVVASLRLNAIAEHQHSVDFLYDFIDIGVWTTLETNTGILCACFPTMGPLLKMFVPGSRRTSRGSTRTSESQKSWTRIQWPGKDAPEEMASRPVNPYRADHALSLTFQISPPPPPYSKEASHETYDTALKEILALEHGKPKRGGSI
ncbi:hypothetical protein MMC28_008362 [Mycoblastus sanguinarius]|nr:hypothetical protein [Mycoblastus sanguinarius]